MFILEHKYCFHCFLGLYWKQWRKSLKVSKMLHFFFKQGQIILSREILASSYSGLIHFFFLAFIHLSSRPPPWPFPRIEFLSLFAAQCFIDLSVIFYPATHPCFIDLSLIWIWNWCRLEWHSFYGPRKQSQELLRKEEGTWKWKPCGLASQPRVRFKWFNLLPRDFESFLPCRKTSPERFPFLGRVKLSPFPECQCPPPIFVAYHW